MYQLPRLDLTSGRLEGCVWTVWHTDTALYYWVFSGSGDIRRFGRCVCTCGFVRAYRAVKLFGADRKGGGADYGMYIQCTHTSVIGAMSGNRVRVWESNVSIYRALLSNGVVRGCVVVGVPVERRSLLRICWFLVTQRYRFVLLASSNLPTCL